MKNLNRCIGKIFESLAGEYLIKNNYLIVERNFYYSHCEIDLIALNGDILVFFEIKGRYNLNYGSPSESVLKNKQRNIIKCAKYFIHRNNHYDKFIRFDVIEICGNNFDNSITLNHIENAFYGE